MTERRKVHSYIQAGIVFDLFEDGSARATCPDETVIELKDKEAVKRMSEELKTRLADMGKQK